MTSSPIGARRRFTAIDAEAGTIELDVAAWKPPLRAEPLA